MRRYRHEWPSSEQDREQVRSPIETPSAPAEVSELQGVDTLALGAEELANPDESIAQLVTEAAEVIEDLERSEAQREQRRELDEFAERIADSVAEKLADHGL